MKKILKGAGYILTILALLFVVRKIISMNIDFHLLSEHLPVFLICITGYAILVYFLGKPWKKFVTVITGQQVEGSEAYYICTKANLMKYIPGNVLQFVGRNELAINHDMRHKDVACATVLDTLCMVLSAVTVAMVFHLKGLLSWLLQYMQLELLIICLLVMIFVGACILILLYRKVPYFRFLFEKSNVKAMITGTAFFWIFYLGTAGMLYLIFHFVLGVSFTVPELSILVGTWAIGYLMGYVMPGAPGGIGIRELVLCFLLQTIINQDTVLLATVLLRVANIFGEIIAFLVALVLYKLTSCRDMSK